MKKLLLCWFLLFSAFNSNASIISISTDKTEVAVGDIVNVSVLGNFAEFDTFFIGVEFDSSLFSFVEDSAFSSLVTQEFDVFVASLIEPSLLSTAFAAIDSSFDGAKTLFSFSLMAISAGISQFNFESINMFFDTGADVIFNETLGTSVIVQEVSAPATMAMMGFILSFIMVRRFQSRDMR